jgi:hypothetical protein
MSRAPNLLHVTTHITFFKYYQMLEQNTAITQVQLSYVTDSFYIKKEMQYERDMTHLRRDNTGCLSSWELVACGIPYSWHWATYPTLIAFQHLPNGKLFFYHGCHSSWNVFSFRILSFLLQMFTSEILKSQSSENEVKNDLYKKLPSAYTWEL